MIKSRIFAFLTALLIMASGINQIFAQSKTGDVDILNEQAIVAYNKSNYEDAIKFFKMLGADNLTLDNLILLANCYDSIGQTNLAVEVLEITTHNFDTDYRAYYNKAGFLFKQGNYSAAIKNYKKCLKYKKNYAPAVYNMGICYYNLEKYKKAYKSFKKSAKLMPEYMDVYHNMALALKKI
ncbi:MAG: tetratricopeptide repeat protein [Candidatus Gastranaerophilales bacterium]|nr:tetratricopeptide repeat protein [Candidatus Gastranaerophilales bacterium]